MKPIALQLYTLREEAAQDFVGVLRQVADMGYVGVEMAGLHGMCPVEVKKVLDDLGLKVTSAHMEMPNAENVGRLVEECRALGITRLISGFGPDQLSTTAGCLAAAETLNAAASALEGSGIALGFHNHYWEFQPVDGRFPEDILLENCPNVFCQIDVYWAAVGGVDPAQAVAERKTRTPLLHIKDGMIEPKMPMTAIGAGRLDFPAIIAAADPAVLEWLIVELDTCEGSMLDAVQQSYDYLVGNGLARGNK